VFGILGRTLFKEFKTKDLYDKEDIEQKIHGKINKPPITDSLLGILNTQQLFY